MGRPLLIVYAKGLSLPLYFFPWRLFQRRDAKKWAERPEVDYVVLTTVGTKRPTQAFWNKHKKGSGHLRLLPGTKKVYVPKETQPKPTPASKAKGKTSGKTKRKT